MASEMLYPIMPLYLQSIGFSVLLIGVLEGVSEAVAGLSKGYFGQLSDFSGKRLPFVRLGYTLSALSKPMLALFAWPVWVFLARTLDRFGKGLRTAPRDALLAAETNLHTAGKIFGFHRSMDTLGAVFGPLIALIYLYFFPLHYKALFLLAFLPGLLAIAASFFLRQTTFFPKSKQHRPAFFSFLKYWKKSNPVYRRLVIGLLFFALFNSSDLFLLLKARQSGLTDTQVIGMYIFYNLVYALFSYPAGWLADRLGPRKLLCSGLLVFAAVYAGMGVFDHPLWILTLFFFYGIYAAATEGVIKAWISQVTPISEIATAMGFYTGFQSFGALLASTFAGIIWYSYSPEVLFFLTATGVLLIAVYFMVGFKNQEIRPASSINQP